VARRTHYFIEHAFVVAVQAGWGFY
jgi:hypothetical protein